ncbi:hypothetical protein ABZX75_11935 [Streptomyces sp. NPDC003038]|uniref:hypothetical protein n=1 Tax=unclassified Streptomyces TaxID=2593676 RepID=UPI0033A58191
MEWQNIGQLADSGADVKVFVVDTKSSVADMLASGIQKDLARTSSIRCGAAPMGFMS